MEYELIVIGGGAGGLSSARAGARRGLSTLLIADGPLGGDCTFTGCVPSKTLIEGARQGLSFVATMARVHDVVAQIAATEDVDTVRAEGVVVRQGLARFIGPRTVAVGGQRFSARRLVIATGSTPSVPMGDGWDSTPYLTNESVLNLTSPPSSLAIVGGGAIGCELAQAYRRLGIEVTLLEGEPTLLPSEDPEAAVTLATVFAREGIDLSLGSTVTNVRSRPREGAEIHTADGGVVEADLVLVAAGRRPNIGGLNVEAGGIALDDRGYIAADNHLETSSPGVYAVGDVTGQFPHTHGADEMGRIAVANAFSHLVHRRFGVSHIPWVTFTDPEIARVGNLEREAAERRGRVAYLPMSEVDRAMTAGRTDGFVKLLAGPRRLGGNLGGGKLLGATIMCEHGGELIHEVALAMRSGMFTGRLAQTVHAYPTWSVAVRQAASQFFPSTGGREARPARRDESRSE